MTNSRGNRSRSRKVNGTASPRLFCTASNAVATCRRRLLCARPQSHSRSRIRSAPERPGHFPSGPHGSARPCASSAATGYGSSPVPATPPSDTPTTTADAGSRASPATGGPFRQPQLGPSAARFPLLARQPVAQGVDQVVVRELVVLPARQGRQAVARGTSGSVGVISRSSPSRTCIRSAKSRGRSE